MWRVQGSNLPYGKARLIDERLRGALTCGYLVFKAISPHIPPRITSCSR